MNATHTPGPWSADVTDWPLLITRADDSDQVVAQINEADRYWPDDDTSRANARLIAAAPEMAELLRDYVNAEPFRGNAIPAYQFHKFYSEKFSALLARIDGGNHD